MIQNPILPGFHPDPSICRVDNDFYLVTSSFSFFPGVPIFHSRDLAHWEQLGYVLDRSSQLPVNYQLLSCGIYAPTIRYHRGRFYVITTNVTAGGKNFIVTAKDPRGPWSEIHVIEGADGIDPSLFFDEDGKTYYTGTTYIEDERGGHQAIWCSEIDLEEMKLVGERSILWGGALVHCWAPEAPHLYKKDGWYYLMIAEGGTEHMHAVTISRSRTVMGQYEGYQGNPILTHRHLGKLYPVCNVGHGDLVELQDGSWYMVMLASRLMDGYHKILGRETFLAPVEWEDGWPVVSPGTGRVEFSYPQPNSLREQPFREGALPLETEADFSRDTLGLEWNQIGTPGEEPFYRMEDGCLKMKLLKNELVPWELNGLPADFWGVRIARLRDRKGDVSFLGRRLQHMDFEAATTLRFAPEQGDGAGLVVIQNDANQLRLEYRRNEEGIREAVCIRTRTVVRQERQYFEESVEGRLILNAAQKKAGMSSAVRGEPAEVSGEVYLKIRADRTRYSFYAGVDGVEYLPVAEGVDGSFLGSETCGGFIGAYVGLFAFSEEAKEAYAAFTKFSYKGIRK